MMDSRPALSTAASGVCLRKMAFPSYFGARLEESAAAERITAEIHGYFTAKEEKKNEKKTDMVYNIYNICRVANRL